MDCVSDTNTQAPKCNTRRHQDGPSSPFYTYVDGTDMSVSDEDMAAVQYMSFLEEQNKERKSGWSEEEILKSLKTTTIRVSQESETCSICMDGYEVNAKIGILSCRHEFHTDCIKDWLLQNNACPICRRPVLKK